MGWEFEWKVPRFPKYPETAYLHVAKELPVKRWDVVKNENVENPKIDAFLDEVIAVCRKHGLSITHEDGHGSFEVSPFKEDYAEWLLCANDSTGEG
jgi:hypothetical protein